MNILNYKDVTNERPAFRKKGRNNTAILCSVLPTYLEGPFVGTSCKMTLL